MRRLYLFRQAYGLTRTEIGELTGLASAVIVRYEGNELYGTHDKLAKFADLYGTTIDFILEKTNFPYTIEYAVANPEAARECYKIVKELDDDKEIIKSFLPPVENEKMKESLLKKRSIDFAIIAPHMEDELSTLSDEDKKRVIELISVLKATNSTQDN